MRAFTSFTKTLSLGGLNLERQIPAELRHYLRFQVMLFHPELGVSFKVMARMANPDDPKSLIFSDDTLERPAELHGLILRMVDAGDKTLRKTGTR